MDKRQRKAAKNQFKEQSQQQFLHKLAADPMLGNYALIQLGVRLLPITQATILSAEDEFELTSQICHKILEKAHWLNPGKRDIFGKHMDETIKQFSMYLQAVYYTHHFESAVGIGDIDKAFHYDGEFEQKLLEGQLAKLTDAYQLMDCQAMFAFVKRAELMANDYDKLHGMDAEYAQLEKDVRAGRLKFIKDNWEAFVME